MSRYMWSSLIPKGPLCIAIRLCGCLFLCNSSSIRSGPPKGLPANWPGMKCPLIVLIGITLIISKAEQLSCVFTRWFYFLWCELQEPSLTWVIWRVCVIWRVILSCHIWYNSIQVSFSFPSARFLLYRTFAFEYSQIRASFLLLESLKFSAKHCSLLWWNV